MTKLFALGFAVFFLSSFASLSMTPPVVVAWAARHEAANTRSSRVLVLPTIEIVGRVEGMCHETTIASR